MSTATESSVENANFSELRFREMIARIDEMIAETQRKQIEQRKLNAEIERISAERKKMNTETKKIDSETNNFGVREYAKAVLSTLIAIAAIVTIVHAFVK